VKKISVIIPCFNEEAVLPQLFQRLNAVVATWGMDCEIICVDDGSRDRTWGDIKTAERQGSTLAMSLLRPEFWPSSGCQRRAMSRNGRCGGDH